MPNRNKQYINKPIPKSFKSEAYEIAMIASFIASAYFKDLYEKMSSLEANGQISECAILFYTKYRNVNWERAKKDKTYVKYLGFTGNITDWDEAIEQWSKDWFNKKGYMK